MQIITQDFFWIPVPPYCQRTCENSFTTQLIFLNSRLGGLCCPPLHPPRLIDCISVWRIEPRDRWLPSLVFGMCVCQALCIGSDAWPARGIQSRPDTLFGGKVASGYQHHDNASPNFQADNVSPVLTMIVQILFSAHLISSAPLDRDPEAKEGKTIQKTQFGINTFEATCSVGSEDGKDEGMVAQVCCPQVQLILGMLPGWDVSQPDETKAKQLLFVPFSPMATDESAVTRLRRERGWRI